MKSDASNVIDHEDAAAQGVRARVSRVRDLILRAANEPAVASALGQHPEAFREEYNLTDEQIEQIKVVSASGALAEIGIPPLDDPEDIAYY